MVTVLLKEISGVAVTQNSEQWSAFRKPPHFYVWEKMRVLCVYLLTELHKKMLVKGLYFNAVDNFNHILQNVINFRWQF